MPRASDAARRKAREEFNLKLRLEASLRRKLHSIHIRMVRSFVRSIAQTGQIPDFQQEFGEELLEVMEAHWTRVGEAFTRRIDRQIKVISIVIAEHYKVRTVESVRQITDAGHRRAATALDVARREARDALLIGEPALAELEIATNAGGIFSRQLQGTETRLVMFNTQEPAESAKLTQVEILSGEPPQIAGGSAAESKMTKEWVNLGDSRVRTGRFDHLHAEQEVRANEPFIVSGQKLRYPGDTSLGASTGNVANCRCSAIYAEAA